MPYKPLRELKPELFADEEEKMNMFAFDDPDSSDEELLSDSDSEEKSDDAEDVPLLQMVEQNQVSDAENNDENGKDHDIPMLALPQQSNQAEMNIVFGDEELEADNDDDDVPLLATARQNHLAEVHMEEEFDSLNECYNSSEDAVLLDVGDTDFINDDQDDSMDAALVAAGDDSSPQHLCGVEVHPLQEENWEERVGM